MATAQQPPEAVALPHNVEAEAALLGALMIDNRLVDHIADKLQPSHFFEPLHGRIFEAVVKEVSLARIATPVTLRPYFADDKAMLELGGPAYLAQLTGSGAAVIGARDFADQVVELARLRAMVGVGYAIADRAGDTSNEHSFAEVVGFAEAEIAAVSGEVQDGVLEVSAAQAIIMAIEPDEMDPGVLSGIEGLDARLGPIKPTELVIVAGRPGMGKTVLGTSYALGVVRREKERAEAAGEQSGIGVLLISLEMGAEQLGERLAADLCFDGHRGVNYAEIEGKRLTAEQARRVARAAAEIEHLPLQIVDVPSLTSAGLDSTVRRWKRRFAARNVELKLVVVDYLQLLRSTDREKDLYTRITEVSKALKGTMKRHRVGGLVIAQLSREVEKRENKRPTLADLRDSGQIEQDADGVVFLFRHDYYLRQTEPSEHSTDPKKQEERAKWELALQACEGQIEFIVAKRRGRPAPVTGRGRFWGQFQAIR
jgi:replicative DNA helicase